MGLKNFSVRQIWLLPEACFFHSLLWEISYIHKIGEHKVTDTCVFMNQIQQLPKTLICSDVGTLLLI